MKLTHIICKNAKSGEKPLRLADGQGLYLEVSPAGHFDYPYPSLLIAELPELLNS